MIHIHGNITRMKSKDDLAPEEKEHFRNTKQCLIGLNVANHVWPFEHTIDFDNATIIDNTPL